jgi:hypothetical protein
LVITCDARMARHGKVDDHCNQELRPGFYGASRFRAEFSPHSWWDLLAKTCSG